MKILLLNPPALKYRRGVDIVVRDISLPPLGIAYIASYLKKNGIQNVKVFDLAFFSVQDAYKSIEPELNSTNIIGISCFTDRRGAAYELVKLINKNYNNIEIVLGGVHSTFLYEQLLRNLPVSTIFLGESEISFFNFIKSKIENKPLNEIKGIVYKDDTGNIINNGFPSLIQNLDEIPFPDISNYELEKYKSNFYEEQIKFKNKNFTQLKQFGIITSRGCPFKCKYCSTSAFWGQNVRFRSIDNVIQEIELLVKKFGIEYILFLDDSFSIKQERVIELCKKIIECRLEFLWSCITRVESLNEEMLYYMKMSNCIGISFGVESGSPKILKNINKKITPDIIRNAFSLAQKNNIKRNVLLMVGNQGENRKTINETLKLLKEISPDSGGWGITTIFPGTELYDVSLKNNYISEDYWLTDKPSPYFCFEQPYFKLKWWLFRIQSYFILKEKKYKIYVRYFFLTLRDIFWIITGYKISLKGIKKIKVELL